MPHSGVGGGSGNAWRRQSTREHRPGGSSASGWVKETLHLQLVMMRYVDTVDDCGLYERAEAWGVECLRVGERDTCSWL
jgi:hypothetical protein